MQNVGKNLEISIIFKEGTLTYYSRVCGNEGTMYGTRKELEKFHNETNFIY